MTNNPIIIALSGRKGSGKDTVAPFVAGWCMDRADRWISDDFLPGGYSVKRYSFADNLKEFCIQTLGLRKEQCYGTDDEKNTLTQYKWQNTPFPGRGVDGSPYMTGREVMQIFGTECVRAWFGNVWADATIRRIREYLPDLAIITDNRFPNEVQAVLNEPKGFIIRLTRNPFGTYDVHPSEASLDDYDWTRSSRCYVLDNDNITKQEQNEAIIPILESIFNTTGEMT